jgi:tRNA A37 threonylcarbamoyladenosine synthetase subunit TsaC/SUA5/YrdC
VEVPGGLGVGATEVGYVFTTTNGAGLERESDAKQRNRDKPGVVLCTSIERLQRLAVDAIMTALARSFPSWDHRHGEQC